jgi:hypothetical protein
MKALWVVVAGLLFVTFDVTGGKGQSRQNSPPPVMSPSPPGANNSPLGRTDPMSPDPLNNRMEQQQIRSRNSDRQKRLVSDTDKLVNLVKQLKEEVESGDKPLEPNDVQKRAEEIEKLAKSVKDRMKG